MYKPKTLSQIWSRAGKELHQVEGQFGNANRRQACAMGAIVFYWTKGETVYPIGLTKSDCARYDKLLIRLAKRTRKTALEWNDTEHLTFKQLASLARKHGL